MIHAPTYGPPLAEEHRSYNPHNLSVVDEELRKHDDTSDGIDWDEIIATSEADLAAGRYWDFDYETWEELDAALKAWLDSILERGLRETPFATPNYGSRQTGY